MNRSVLIAFSSASFAAILLTLSCSAGGGGGGSGEGTAGRSARCLSAQDSIEVMTPASYAVVFTYQYGNGPGEFEDIFYGTAFAIDRRTLGTNAHITTGLIGLALEATQYGFPYSITAIQSGTGTVVNVLLAVTHPSWFGDPLGDPDVGLLTCEEELPDILALADPDDVDLAAAEELVLTGFPGAVQDIFGTHPGVTVPQATALTGTVTSLRNFDSTIVVTAETVDIIQHQLPTSPGDSGSPITHCGKVVAVNNAGTVQLVVVLDQNGNAVEDRVPVANDNFGIHVRHLQNLLDQYEDRAVEACDLYTPLTCVGLLPAPPAAVAVCGNGAIETGEGCEPPNTAACDAACQPVVAQPAVCGNDVIEAGEGCEPPNTAACSAACQAIGGGGGAVGAACGNGIFEAGEGCDPPDGLFCTATCQDDCVALGFYGDGICDACPFPDPDCTGGGAGGCDTCAFSFDGECDDGSPGAVTSLCAPGTDCSDCGGG